MSGIRGAGRGIASRVPLRGFASLLNNLSPVVKNRVETAFAEAEDLLNFHNQDVPDQEERRRPSGLIQAPRVEVESSILGGSARWDRLNDSTIIMYEVQTDTISSFPDPNSFTVLEPFFGLESINTPIFIRVRGVRQDGQAGLFSDLKVIQPTTTAPTAHSFTFYQDYFDSGGNPSLGKSLRWSELENVPNSFYTIFSASIDNTDNRLTGGVMIWGYLSARAFRFKKDVAPFAWDRVRVLINGAGRFDHLMLLGSTQNGFFGSPPETGAFRGPPIPTASFYAKDGYTVAWGPWVEEFPGTSRGQGPQDPEVVSNDATTGSVAWVDFGNVKTPTPPYRSKAVDPIAASTFATPESRAVLPTVGDESNLLKMQDFKFDIPSNFYPEGIKVQVKKRARMESAGDPPTSSVSDVTVSLIDPATGAAVGDNKATVDFWPVVTTDGSYSGTVLPLDPPGYDAVADDIGHRSAGYTEYGGEDDLWGKNWTAAELNDPDFGVLLSCENTGPVGPFDGVEAYVDHCKVTVYFDDFYQKKRFDIDVQVKAQAGFYLEREAYGAVINAIEFGEILDLSDPFADC